MEREKEQEVEWKEAQSTAISVDLVSAAKVHLSFLAAVDRNRWLYQVPALHTAIYRYNACWLPLLAKHSESQLFEGPLVVPFDCEWVWHCHRLNPVRYKSDCEEFYGRILDNRNVVSSLDGTPPTATEEIWKTLFPGEPFELDSTKVLQDDNCAKKEMYDLISAVQRQAPFTYQVSRPYMNDDRYLEGAVARYKAFLHLIKRNKERNIKSFSVPTYDIDLIWHTHQLHPVSYCKDLVQIMGKILEHDDTDSDRTKGQKLDVGFSGTTKTFEKMFGARYWRAGAMYRGSAPSPVRTTPYTGIAPKKVAISNAYPQITLLQTRVIEVMLEFVGVRNVPVEHKGSFFVSFSKRQPDEIFNTKRSLTIFSESGEKQVATFQCEPTGHLLFELMSSFPSNIPLYKSLKTIGTAAISFEDFMSPESNLTEEKWLELVPSSNKADAKPIGLRVAISVTIPNPVPYVLHMTRSRAFPKNSCLFPLPMKVQYSKSWTRVIDEAENLVMSLQMRDSKRSKGKRGDIRREVVGILKSGETRALAQFADLKWSMVNSPWSLQLPNVNNDDGHLLELGGPHTVRLFSGGRLDYESRRCDKHNTEDEKLESNLITAIEFSAENPYGRAVALLDLKSGNTKVKEDWFLVPGLILTFIIGSIFRKEGYNSLIVGSKNRKEKSLFNEEVGEFSAVGSDMKLDSMEKEVEFNVEAVKKGKGGACGGGGCGSGCGNDVRSGEFGGCGGCGGCGGGGCGNVAKSGGCGSGCGGGCGSGCGDMANSGGCGSGCGGGCGSGCGNMTKSGGCGGCGGGCGNKLVEVPGNEVLVA